MADAQRLCGQSLDERINQQTTLLRGGPAEPPGHWAAVQRQLQWSLRFRKGGTLPRVCQGKVGFGLLGNVPLNTITEHPAHWDCRAAKENPSKEESEELVKTRFFGARKVLD